MQFVRTDELKTGMRLARPIYNKKGVLLYERNSKLTPQGISSIKNFGLIGLFVLEPAEPVPPMTEEDIAFERFQTMQVFAIQEELNKILQTEKAQKIQVIAANIIKEYGRLDHKINFIQNLRSKEDFIYKHSLNVAMLCAMMARSMHIMADEQLQIVLAAIVSDIGILAVPPVMWEKEELTEQEKTVIESAKTKGFELIEQVFAAHPDIKRICVQCQKTMMDLENGKKREGKMFRGAKILMAAKLFDQITAMQVGRTPQSQVAALKYLKEHTDYYGETVVQALIHSIHIISPGICVELNNGDKGVVLIDNPANIFKPMILGFRDNKMINLNDESTYGDLEIVDIMRTLDNRYIMDAKVVQDYGFKVDEPVFVQAKGAEGYEEYVPGRDF